MTPDDLVRRGYAHKTPFHDGFIYTLTERAQQLFRCTTVREALHAAATQHAAERVEQASER